MLPDALEPSIEEKSLITVSTDRVGSRQCHEYFESNGITPLPIRGYPWVSSLPDEIIDAARRALTDPHIPPTLGLLELRQRLASEATRRNGSDVAPEEVVVTAGAMAGMQVLWCTFAEPGGNVVVPVPSYFSRGGIELAHQQYRPVSALKDPDGWDWDQVERAIDAKTTAVYVVNPNNPTGDLLSHDDFTALATISQRWPALWLVFDESYEALVYSPWSYQSALRYRSLLPKAVVVGSFSKSFAMPWLRVGFVVVPRALVHKVQTSLEWMTLYGSYVTQSIALAAIAGDRSWLNDMVEEFRTRRDYFVTRIAEVGGLEVKTPRAGPFIYPNVKGKEFLRVEDVLELWSGGLEVIPSPCFGEAGAALRIPFGGAVEHLDKAIEIIHDWAQSL
jgi:aspartate/methionine/tyrosine aminotransferase